LRGLAIDVANPSGVAHIRTASADTDNVAGRVNAVAGKTTQGNVVAACVVVDEGGLANGRVEIADGITKKRILTGGRVFRPGVAKERLQTGGSVSTADGVAKERFITGGHVAGAGGVVKKGHRTAGSVGAAGRVRQERFDASGRILVPSIERECSSANPGVRAAGGHAEERIPTNSCVSSTGGEAQKGVLAFSGVEVGIAPTGRLVDADVLIDRLPTPIQPDLVIRRAP
jgi:hypothetical protein